MVQFTMDYVNNGECYQWHILPWHMLPMEHFTMDYVNNGAMRQIKYKCCCLTATFVHKVG